MSLIYLTTFGATTLHNGSTVLAQETAVQPRQAEPRLLPLPNGGFFDLDGSSPTRFKPASVSCIVFINASSKSAAATTLNALTAMVGTRATLTGAKLEGGTVTCTARCTELKIASNHRLNGQRIKVTITFQPVNDWT